MKKITRITITNYRAFFNEKQQPDDKPKYQIDLPQGQNLLVYGENGSGKSSLFHAISDFFESADNEEISIEENIFTDGVADLPAAKVELQFSEKDANGIWQPIHTELENAGTPNEKIVQKPLEFSKNSSTTTANILLKEASQAFLSYRDMLKTYFLAIDDKDTNPNLFDLFIGRLLSKITEPAQNESINAALRDIQNDVADFRNIISGVLVAKTEADPTDNTPLEEIRDDQKQLVEDKILAFNESISAVLNDTMGLVNHYLETYFKVNLKISLLNVNEYIKLIDDGVTLQIKQELFFEIEYFGKKLEGKTYQTFLNEARLSALSVCIYLAAVKKDKPAVNNYKILFLDDIFIGLDMSNRLPLLEILNKDFSDFQIFMTTYDRHWFEVAKDWLNNKQKDIWRYLEIYNAYNKDSSIQNPVIYDSLGYLEKAEFHLNRFEYTVCANYLRKTLEKRMKELIPSNILFVEKFDKATGQTEIRKEGNLSKMIDIFIGYCNEDEKELDDIKRLKNLKDWYFNPFSHDNIEKPIYRKELELALSLLKNISVYQSGVILDPLTELSFQFLKPTGETKNYKIILAENLRHIKTNTSESLSNAEIEIFEWSDATTTTAVKWKNKLVSFYNNRYKEFWGIDPEGIDLFTTLKLTDGADLRSISKY